MIKKILKYAAISIFWVLVWQAVAMIVDDSFLIPTPLETLKALSVLGQTPEFYEAALESLLRIIIGFSLGAAIGFIGGVASNRFPLFSDFAKPALQVVKAVPVASFIILTFFWFQSDEIPTFIAFLMVVPIIWAATQTALSEIDYKYIELAKIYKLNSFKVFFKIKLRFIIPTLLTACSTALGFAWKSGIAAEVICRPQIALGTLLNDNKNYFDMPSVFALTVVVAILSIILETILKLGVRRVISDKN